MRRVFARDFAAGIRPGAALALFRVFAVPRLSARLAGTGGWEQGPSTRLERTVELLAALIEDGYDGPRGAAALARINAAHAGRRIANDDMLYVLVCDPAAAPRARGLAALVRGPARHARVRRRAGGVRGRGCATRAWPR